MNYGHLRDVFSDGNILTTMFVLNLPKEIQGILFVLIAGEANSDFADNEELPDDARERYERLIELLPKELKFCCCTQNKDMREVLDTLGSDFEEFMVGSFFM